MLKQRLIGAVVLVALGVIFIPMMLTGDGNFLSGELESNIPPKPMYEIQAPKVLPLGKRQGEPSEAVIEPIAQSIAKSTPEDPQQQNTADERANVSADTVASVDADNDSLAATKQTVSSDKTSDKTSITTTTTTKTTTAKSSASEKIAVDKTAAIRADLASKSTTESEKQAADSNTKTTSKSTASDRVASIPENRKKPIVNGWVVQLGSFSVQKNAQQLRDRLRKKGHASFVEEYTHSDKTSYRVRVGPEISRELANTLKQTLKAETKIDGLVIAFP